MKLKRLLRVVLVAGIIIAGLIGCNYVRKVTYPPDFVYLDRKEIVGAMAEFSVDLWRIDDILSHSETILPYQREEIIDLLKHMEDIADKLGAGATQTNHLLIDQHIDQFKDSVWDARRTVEADPPNYYLAGRLSGSCNGCHIYR